MLSIYQGNRCIQIYVTALCKSNHIVRLLSKNKHILSAECIDLKIIQKLLKSVQTSSHYN